MLKTLKKTLHTLVIAKKSNNRGSQTKRKKLTGFINWSVCSGITESMLIKKDVKDLVLIGPWPQHEHLALFLKKMKEDQMAVSIA